MLHLAYSGLGDLFKGRFIFALAKQFISVKLSTGGKDLDLLVLLNRQCSLPEICNAHFLNPAQGGCKFTAISKTYTCYQWL